MGRILIVDDQDDEREVLALILSRAGHTCVSACNGQEALDLALASPPEAVISDVMMPVMDGFVLCRKWKADPRLNPIPFLIYTATDANSRAEQLALGIGADAFLVKPQQAAELLRVLDSILAAPARTPGPDSDALFKQEMEVLRLYNETLFRKLSSKMEELQAEITERRRAEAALKEGEERLSLLLNSTGEGLYAIDLTGICNFVNPACLHLIGFDRPEEVLGRNMHDLIHHTTPDGRPRPARDCPVINGVLKGGGVHFEDDIFWRRDGSSFPVEYWSYAQCKDGKVVGIVVTFVDITLRKNAENEVRTLNAELETRVRDRTADLDAARLAALDMMQQADENRRKAEQAWQKLRESTRSLRLLSQAVEDSPAVVMITNPKGQIEYVNPRFTQVTGFESAEVINQTPSLLNSGHHPSEYFAELWQTLLGGKPWSGEMCNRKKSGETYWQSASIAPVRGEDEEISHFVAVTEDITDRRQFVEQIKDAKVAAEAANRAKSAFLASMSHEIRTPMNAILGFTELLLRDEKTTPAQRERLELIDRAADHLLGLINDILEMSKIEAGRATLNLSTFDLERAVGDVAQMFEMRCQRKGLLFTVEREPGLPRAVRGDEGKLRQILINLLGNAVKFTSVGVVSLAVGRRSGSLTQLFAEVRDTGPGIAEADRGRLFQHFSQTEVGMRAGGGTGLGLAICRSYALLLGGDVTCSSELGRGSTFTLDFVVEPGHHAELPAVASQQVAGLAAGEPTRRVLIVDDVVENRRLLTELLRGAGFQTCEAADGCEAVRLFESWRPDAILMDRQMPGVDGCEATRKIRALPGGARTPIVMVSASALDEQRQEALDAGVDGFVRKPFRPEEIFGELGRLCGVQYRYVESTNRDAGGAQLLGPGTAARFDLLPASQAGLMREATASGDMSRLKTLIAGLASEHGPAAARLQAMADDYEYQALLDLFDRVLAEPRAG
ncbi:MAG: response regulator [Candidatus Wallbacteria bacterium]|nr:response regulator [Candidatus Wallbacteria bacterium]